MIRRGNDALTAQFAECADMLLDGASMAACLERFPEHATQLEPMLISIMRVRGLCAVPARSAETAAASHALFMVEAAHVQASLAAIAAAVPWWQRVFTVFQPAGRGERRDPQRADQRPGPGCIARCGQPRRRHLVGAGYSIRWHGRI